MVTRTLKANSGSFQGPNIRYDLYLVLFTAMERILTAMAYNNYPRLEHLKLVLAGKYVPYNTVPSNGKTLEMEGADGKALRSSTLTGRALTKLSLKGNPLLWIYIITSEMWINSLSYTKIGLPYYKKFSNSIQRRQPHLYPCFKKPTV